MTITIRRICALIALAGAGSTAAISQASFHEWDIKEIFTSADGSVQFIELFTNVSGQGFLNGHTLTANSDGAIVTYTFSGNLAGSTANRHLLLATANFGAIAGGVAQNYAALPSNFFNPSATNITFDFAHLFDVVTVAGSSIPKDGVNSLTDSSVLTPQTTLLAGVNSPTNFAGATGSVNLGGATPIPGDFTGNGVVDGADLAVWRTNFAAAGAPTTMQGNADADADVDGRDFLIWQRNAAAAPATATALAIPEPASAMLAALAAGALTLHRRRRALNPRQAHRSP